MTASNANNVIFSKEGTTVTLATTRDEENLTKTLTLIGQPKSTNEQDITEGKNPTQILDLLMKAEERYTFTGSLTNGLRTVAQGDTSENAEGKKSDLKKIFLAGGVVAMTYEGSTINVGLEKATITRVNKEGYTGVVGVKDFDVTITCVKGEDL